jgi:hypothetical protein
MTHELTVDVAADGDRATHRLHVGFLHQDLPRLYSELVMNQTSGHKINRLSTSKTGRVIAPCRIGVSRPPPIVACTDSIEQSMRLLRVPSYMSTLSKEPKIKSGQRGRMWRESEYKRLMHLRLPPGHVVLPLSVTFPLNAS